MKKLLLLFLVTTSFFISASKKKLENAIMESDLTTVRSLLKTTTLEENERYSLYKLSKNILKQRRSIFSFMFPSGNSIRNLLITLGLTVIPSVMSTLRYDYAYGNGLIFIVIPFFAGGTLLPAVIIKNFYDYKRWTNAIVIKTLFEKKEYAKGEQQ